MCQKVNKARCEKRDNPKSDENVVTKTINNQTVNISPHLKRDKGKRLQMYEIQRLSKNINDNKNVINKEKNKIFWRMEMKNKLVTMVLLILINILVIGGFSCTQAYTAIINNQHMYQNDYKVYHLDRINNTGTGYSSSASQWLNLGNGSVATSLYGSKKWNADGLYFDGNGDYINLDQRNETNMFKYGGFTLEICCKVSSGQFIFGNYDGAGAEIELYDGTLQGVAEQSSNGSNVWIDSNTAPSSSEFYTLQLTILSDGTMKFYVDGVLKGTKTLSGGLAYPSNRYYRAGAKSSNSATSVTSYMKGTIASIRYYTKAISDAQAKAHATADKILTGETVDSSQITYTIVIPDANVTLSTSNFTVTNGSIVSLTKIDNSDTANIRYDFSGTQYKLVTSTIPNIANTQTVTLNTASNSASKSVNVYRTAPVTVTFNANGGSCSTATASKTYGSTYGTLPTATRSGYVFQGWFTASSGGTQITASSTVTATVSITLYAQWKLENTLTVTAKTLTYNGSAQTLVSVSGAQGTVYYSTSTALTGSNYSSSGSTTVSTGTNAGSYTVYYYTPGNTSYAVKSGNVAVTISKIANPISISGKTLNYDGSNQTLVSVSGAQGTVYYSTSTSLTSSNYTSGSTTASTGKNAGSYTVYYYVEGNTNYNAKNGSVSATINKIAPSFSLSQTSLTIQYGGNGTVTITYNGDGTLNVSSASTSVATASLSSKTITIAAGNVGSTVVTVSASAGTNYSAPSNKTISVSVVDSVSPTGTISIATIYGGYTNSNTFTVTLTASDNVTAQASMKVAILTDDTFSSATNSNITWEDFSATKTVTVPAGEGTKNIYVIFKDESGNQSFYLS